MFLPQSDTDNFIPRQSSYDTILNPGKVGYDYSRNSDTNYDI